MTPDSTGKWPSFPRDLADRCVKCAQCLPACPTWRISRDEAESPRGRIALMMGVADGLVDADRDVVQHLDQCLGCRRCEAVCPADVPYGLLTDAAQAALAANPATAKRAPLVARLLRRLVARPKLFNRIVVPLLRAASFVPIRHPLLPPRAAAAPAPGVYPAFGDAHGDVSLFLGCVARAIDGATLGAALHALRVAGYDVQVPARQACCGALHLHAGDPDTARKLSARNATAFSGTGPIAACASGCAPVLRADPAIGARVHDVSALLAGRLTPRPAHAGTVLHTPCTAEPEAPQKLLSGMRVLPVHGRCCGAAGEYLLRQPRLAARLRDTVLDDIGDAPVVCTSNPGCAVHLRAGLAARGVATRVTHPVIEWLNGDG